MAGIGGKTVAEAKANLSYKEVADWVAYVKQFGSISPVAIQKRNEKYLEWTSAKICWAMFKAMGAKDIEIKDFMAQEKESEEEQKPADIKDVFNLLKSLKSRNDGRK